MWRETLRSIVAFYASDRPRQDPTFLYDAEPPRSTPWPESLPLCQGLQDFYCLCGRGEVGPMIRFIPLVELEKETSHWINLLRDYDTRGDVLQAGQHIVFANDADGTPWIWDSATGRVASFYWKGGDWEQPSFLSFDDFMDYILSPRDDDPSWANALQAFTNRST